MRVNIYFKKGGYCPLECDATTPEELSEEIKQLREYDDIKSYGIAPDAFDDTEPQKSELEFSEFVRRLLSMSSDKLDMLEKRLLRLDIDSRVVREIIAAAKYVKEYNIPA
jgi:hypothetical protein